MAYAPNRSKNDALQHGAYEGRYIEDRPNTEDGVNHSGPNSSKTMADRRSLNQLNGFTTAEYPSMINPGA